MNILKDSDAKKTATWLPQYEEKRKIEYKKENISDEDLEKIKKMELEINRDIKRILSNMSKLYKMNPSKELYDSLVTIKTVQRN